MRSFQKIKYSALGTMYQEDGEYFLHISLTFRVINYQKNFTRVR